jgi:hypothetical protein
MVGHNFVVYHKIIPQNFVEISTNYTTKFCGIICGIICGRFCGRGIFGEMEKIAEISQNKSKVDVVAGEGRCRIQIQYHTQPRKMNTLLHHTTQNLKRQRLPPPSLKLHLQISRNFTSETTHGEELSTRQRALYDEASSLTRALYRRCLKSIKLLSQCTSICTEWYCSLNCFVLCSVFKEWIDH